jgi:antitoxin component YwqK of YwqJK toxin-antitoxin module
MKLLSRHRLLNCLVATAVAASGCLFCVRAFAQGAAAAPTDSSGSAPSRLAKDRVKVQPYTGKPIYLDQQEVVVAPTIVTHEPITEKYEKDGTPRVERQVARFSDNHFEADGFYREYYPNGKPFVVGEFRLGRQHGEWTYSYDNGQVNRKAVYKDGQPDGTWEVFRADGTLLAKRGFKDGQRHGEWIEFDSTGKQPLRESHYGDGKADGAWKVWYPNGQMKQQVNFKQGKREGLSEEWLEKGEKRSEVTFADDKLDGPTTVWLPDGSKVVQEYKAGKLIPEKKE